MSAERAHLFYTLKIWQSSFAQRARVVTDVDDDTLSGIEARAPCDGGEMVALSA
jgi:hypothetical protein